MAYTTLIFPMAFKMAKKTRGMKVPSTIEHKNNNCLRLETTEASEEVLQEFRDVDVDFEIYNRFSAMSYYSSVLSVPLQCVATRAVAAPFSVLKLASRLFALTPHNPTRVMEFPP